MKKLDIREVKNNTKMKLDQTVYGASVKATYVSTRIEVTIIDHGRYKKHHNIHNFFCEDLHGNCREYFIESSFNALYKYIRESDLKYYYDNAPTFVPSG